MKKAFAVLIFAVALPLFSADQTFTGIITDSMCPKGDHSDMKAKSDAECVRQCMTGMKNMKYVLWDGKNTYSLSDQQTPAKFPAQKVTVTGTLDAKTKTIQVTAMTAAK
jgi:hypothetical protein